MLSRRVFCKSVGGGFATVAEARIGSTREQVSIAFLGLGPAGFKELQCAARVPGIRIAAIYDRSPREIERASALVRTLGVGRVRVSTDFREVIGDSCVDAVCISAGPQWRAGWTIEACKAGKDVYVTYPPCVSAEEGLRIVETARQSRRVVQTGAIHRSSPVLRKVREMVTNGELGSVAFCRAFQPEALDVVQFAFGEVIPHAISAQPGSATLHYPAFVLSLETRTEALAVFFHGALATLSFQNGGYVVFPHGTREIERTDIHAAHWINFLECIETRETPAAGIENSVRSAGVLSLAGAALRARSKQEDSFE